MLAAVASEYDPVFAPRADGPESRDLAEVKRLFSAASRPYLSAAFPWFFWSLVLPAAAVAAGRLRVAASPAGQLGLWSAAILLGGGVEAFFLYRHRRRLGGGSPLGSWAMTLQGNLSLVAVALSIALVAAGEPKLLAGLWLLLLGHSLFALGGLAFPPQRTAGLVYQLGGAVALLPGVPELTVFAVTAALGNFWIGVGVLRRNAAERTAG
jgi:hypothetical protein